MLSVMPIFCLNLQRLVPEWFEARLSVESPVRHSGPKTWPTKADSNVLMFTMLFILRDIQPF